MGGGGEALGSPLTKFAEPLGFASRGELSSPARGEVGWR